MTRVYNFSAGPAMLPEVVLKKAREEMCDWQGTGMSVMEMSHRGKAFMEIAARAEADFRELLGISDDYRVLFLQGGASAQFSMVPINLLGNRKKADYFNTGQWSKKAIAEARRFCDVNIVASSADEGYCSVPDRAQWQLDPDAAYVHYTPNETIGGVEFAEIPSVGDVTLVADMSSTLLSRPLDINRFGIIYAGAQKNIGPAGLTLVIVRKDLIGEPLADMPVLFDYRTHANNDSMYNTPPTYSWYIAGLVFSWLKELGGLETMARINERKAASLYAAIDGSDFYSNPVNRENRSWMNVPFTLANDALDSIFLQEAAELGLQTLKGHRSVGGMRASIYNAMPEAGVEALVAFMQDFAQRYG